MLNRYVLLNRRELLKLSRDTVATSTGLSAATIQTLETDPEANPTLDTLFRLAKFYQISPDLLFTYSEPVDNEAMAVTRFLIARSQEPTNEG